MLIVTVRSMATVDLGGQRLSTGSREDMFPTDYQALGALELTPRFEVESIPPLDIRVRTFVRIEPFLVSAELLGRSQQLLREAVKLLSAEGWSPEVDHLLDQAAQLEQTITEAVERASRGD